MKLLKKVSICGQTYSVYSVGKGEVKNMGRAEGMTEAAKSEIYLKEKLLKNPDRFLDTLIHEVLHAIFDASGFGHWLKAELRLRGNKWFQFQETFIRLLTPALLSTFKSMGFLPANKRFK